MRLLQIAALFIAMFVAGCTDAPYLRARLGPPSADAPAHEQGTFVGAANTTLFEQSWHPAGPARAALVIVHGLKDHSSRYDAFARALTARGFAVYAFDLRGHGRSEGVRAYCASFDDYLDDVQTFLARVRAREPGRPLFLFGHSMGGAIATLFTIDRKPELRGLLLSGAALRVDAAGIVKAITRKIGRSAPFAVVLKLDLKRFSRDPNVVRDNANDPLVYQPGVPARTAANLIDAIDRIRARDDELTLPLLVMHGGADRITPPDGSRDLIARARSTDKTLKIYPGLYHDLLHEPERAQVTADILAWLEAHAQ